LTAPQKLVQQTIDPTGDGNSNAAVRCKIACDQVRYVTVLNERPRLPGSQG